MQLVSTECDIFVIVMRGAFTVSEGGWQSLYLRVSSVAIHDYSDMLGQFKDCRINISQEIFWLLVYRACREVLPLNLRPKLQVVA
jgi:hypothetical protein